MNDTTHIDIYMHIHTHIYITTHREEFAKRKKDTLNARSIKRSKQSKTSRLSTMWLRQRKLEQLKTEVTEKLNETR
jgi:hypothetical protein